MGKNTIKVTINETGQSKSNTITVLDPEFIEGYWASDKEGNKKLQETTLGATVYFHVKTKGISPGQKIELRLAEYDYSYFANLFVSGSRLLQDIIDPDDRKFPKKEVSTKVIVKNNKAVIELTLHESWEPLIKDDSNNSFSLDEKLELYWEANYNNKYKTELPKRTIRYLKVGYSKRTLYFKTPLPNHNLPEFISSKGDPMIIMKFSKNLIINKIKGAVLDYASKKSAEKITSIALAKLSKGSLVDNTGKVYTGKRLIHEYKKIYSNSGELFENVKIRKNFGYSVGNGIITTKGISQYDYFSKNGKRVQLLGIIGKLGDIFNMFNIAKSLGEDLDTTKPIPLDLGPLQPISDIAGALVQEQKAIWDTQLEASVQQTIDQAKLQGLEATRNEIEKWNHDGRFKWDLLPISNQTANKLIAGEFKTFNELEGFHLENRPRNAKIEILYRKIRNENREENIFIIETIFINE